MYEKSEMRKKALFQFNESYLTVVIIVLFLSIVLVLSNGDKYGTYYIAWILLCFVGVVSGSSNIVLT